MSRPVLVLQMQRMGDLILTFPALLWMARQVPGRAAWVVAERTFFEQLIPLGPEVMYIPWEETDWLEQKRFELLVNLSGRQKAAELSGRIASRMKIGPESSPAGRWVHGDWQLYRASIVHNNRYNRFHWAELNALDVVDRELIASTQWPPPRRPSARGARIGLFLGASEEAKRPSPAFWAGLADALHARGHTPLLLGGPAERELGAEVARMADCAPENHCGAYSLAQLAQAMQRMDLLVSPDTGPMHLAAWRGLPTLNLSMGNVQPWETAPYQPGHWVLRADMDCAHGCWSCTRQRLYCHDPFAPERTAAFVAGLLRRWDAPERIGRTAPEGLRLYRTGRGEDGLYNLIRMDEHQPDPDDLLALFWKQWFGELLGLWRKNEVACRARWNDFAQSDPEGAARFVGLLPELAQSLKRGLRTGGVDEDFWSSAAPRLRPLTGYLHLLLQNGDFSPHSWSRCLRCLEDLAARTD